MENQKRGVKRGASPSSLHEHNTTLPFSLKIAAGHGGTQRKHRCDHIRKSSAGSVLGKHQHFPSKSLKEQDYLSDGGGL
jgi:hypothetical protein